MTDNDISFFHDEQEPVMAPIKSDKIVRTNNPVFYQASKNPVAQKSSTSKSLNILSQNKVSTKL
jgi:hypothetical protein